jgi:hypothetical protein
LRTRPALSRLTSVREDWRSPLPEEETQVYQACVQQLELAYGMLSVSLNEAIGLRRIGHLAKAYEAVCVTPALSSLLTSPLAGLLRAMLEHAKHYGTIPMIAPLDPANFQGSKGQRSARMSALLSLVLLTRRSQFLHKIATLHEMVEDLGRDFRTAAEELGTGTPQQPLPYWDVLDATHYDLNTCLRETIVLLKCFLLALPGLQLAAFQKTVRAQLSTPEPAQSTRQRLIPHGRMAPVGGE